MQSLLVLGRQPELGLAELSSLYSEDKVKLINPQVALVDVDPCWLAYDRLGGSVKFAKLLVELEVSSWPEVVDYLTEVAPAHAQQVPPGKLQLGLSLYGFKVPLKQIHQAGLRLKKAIAQTGRSVRLVPNQKADLGSAQVIHNKLTRPNGWELLIIKAKNKVYIGQSVKVQDIASYSKRDYDRPSRQPRIGMLPPKLAQIIINLAQGQLGEEVLTSICDIPEGESTRPVIDQTVLDPFCGSGVIIQEALLMGYRALGADRDPAMLKAAEANLMWLVSRYQLDQSRFRLSKADARSATWDKFDLLASEVDLGPPLSSLPAPAELESIIKRSNQLVGDFLTNLSAQQSKGSRLCLALPAWQIGPGRFKKLPLIDQIADFGYNLVKFGAADELIYYRSEQIVGRQLLTLKKR